MTRSTATSVSAYKLPKDYVRALVRGLVCVLSPWTFDADASELRPLRCNDATMHLLRSCRDFNAARNAETSSSFRSCQAVARSLVPGGTAAGPESAIDVAVVFSPVRVDDGFGASFASSDASWRMKHCDVSRAPCLRVNVCAGVMPVRRLSLAVQGLGAVRISARQLSLRADWRVLQSTMSVRALQDLGGPARRGGAAWQALFDVIMQPSTPAVVTVRALVRTSLLVAVVTLARLTRCLPRHVLQCDDEDAVLSLRLFRRGAYEMHRTTVHRPSVLLVTTGSGAGSDERVWLATGIGFDGAWSQLLGVGGGAIDAGAAVHAHWWESAGVSWNRRTNVEVLLVEVWRGDATAAWRALAADAMARAVMAHGRVRLEEETKLKVCRGHAACPERRARRRSPSLVLCAVRRV